MSCKSCVLQLQPLVTFLTSPHQALPLDKQALGPGPSVPSHHVPCWVLPRHSVPEMFFPPLFAGLEPSPPRLGCLNANVLTAYVA